GRLGVFVALVVHDVAPVAPHRADVEQDRAVLAPRPLERLVAPRQPGDGLLGAVPQERAAGAGQTGPRSFSHHAPPRPTDRPPRLRPPAQPAYLNPAARI